eukprot:TRINITY_DN4742_c0_g1_i3.p2 TRINITY_DN4742_c0_g1~~TRINITY_DN4742_c0_g1_i3.p2  ORF type:complete len:102 (-),score=12.31 TRINITY_DN4742_c0_g1_i3:370-675(-)
MVIEYRILFQSFCQIRASGHSLCTCDCHFSLQIYDEYGSHIFTPKSMLPQQRSSALARGVGSQPSAGIPKKHGRQFRMVREPYGVMGYFQDIPHFPGIGEI